MTVGKKRLNGRLLSPWWDPAEHKTGLQGARRASEGLFMLSGCGSSTGSVCFPQMKMFLCHRPAPPPLVRRQAKWIKWKHIGERAQGKDLKNFGLFALQSSPSQLLKSLLCNQLNETGGSNRLGKAVHAR